MGPPQSDIEERIQALKHDDDGSVGVHLLQIGAAAVAPLIQALLHDDDIHVRWRVALILGVMADTRAVIPLLRAMDDPQWDVRLAALQALKQMDAAVAPLIDALQHTEAMIRVNAANVLRELEDERAVEPLIHVLQSDEETDVREAAAFALGRLENGRAVEPLLRALRDIAGNVRLTAASALKRMGSAAIEPLITALQHDETSIREGAAKALAEVGDDQAIAPLRTALEKEPIEYLQKVIRELLTKLESRR